MPGDNLARWQDLVVIAINLGIMIAIGVYCARKTRSADAYFLADRSMPGWVVGFSMMATIASSMTVKPRWDFWFISFCIVLSIPLML